MGWISKRRWLCCMVIVWWFALTSEVQAQTYSEWFRQKKTQRSYLLQQIVALRAYGSQLAKSYSLIKDGWQTVKGFSQGEFDLHRIYLNSLKLVHPLVAKDPRVAESVEAVLNVRLVWAGLEKLELDAQQGAYVAKVMENLLAECDKDLVALEDLLAKGKLEMTDDQRLQRLVQLHAGIKDKEAFSRDFVEQLRQMQLAGQVNRKEINQMRRLHE